MAALVPFFAIPYKTLPLHCLQVPPSLAHILGSILTIGSHQHCLAYSVSSARFLPLATPLIRLESHFWWLTGSVLTHSWNRLVWTKFSFVSGCLFGLFATLVMWVIPLQEKVVLSYALATTTGKVALYISGQSSGDVLKQLWATVVSAHLGSLFSFSPNWA